MAKNNACNENSTFNSIEANCPRQIDQKSVSAIKRKLPSRLPRPRIQRAFVRWFQENRLAFNVPVHLVKVSAAGILLKFPNHPDCLSVWLSRWDLSVVVTWQEICWDLLLSLDAIPKPVPGGYGCDSCIDEKQVWKTREDYWADHLFAPFLLWVNEQLANAGTLNLYGSQHCSTWAVLMASNISLPNRMPVQVLIHSINNDSYACIN